MPTLTPTSTTARFHCDHIRGDARGIASAFEFALRFTLWAGKQHAVSWQSIQSEFGVSRATAYRWLAGWRAAQGHTNHHEGLG